jgi:NAD(P)-dependent dehydrogenase (short-subunit alcohol dehydrogenase family)
MAGKQAVIVTGASQGVGAAVAQSFLDRGHKNNPKDFLKTLSPVGTISDSKNIADAVVYLTEARYVTGEVLHLDGGAHAGRW